MIRYCLLLQVAACFLIPIASEAQTAPTNVEPDIILEYSQIAEKSFEHGDYNKSLTYFLKVDSLMPNQAAVLYDIGICYLNTNYKRKALPYLEKVKKMKYQEDDLDYELGQAYHYNLRFDDALKSFQEYLTLVLKDSVKEEYIIKDVRRRIQICHNAKELVKDSIPIEIANVGHGVNTKFDEYVPVVSADLNTMYFTSRRHGSNAKIHKDGKHYEDIFKSVKDKDGNWGKASVIHYPLNGPDHDACIGITPDAQTMFLFRTRSNDPYKGHVYVSKLKGNVWGTPEKLGSNINTKKGWESSVSISQDLKRLYFSSDRPGGFGGLDIWYSDLDANQEWGPAKNAGAAINTEYDEDSPFIHFDNKTLFFSSRGHNTMGGFDVFSSVYSTFDNAFGKPRNLGYPINTTEDDMYFVYSADGSKGFMSMVDRDDSYGERDIYQVNRPHNSKSMVVVKGTIVDDEHGTPIESKITVTDLETNASRTYNSNSATGKYVLALDFGKNYAIQFEAKGYIFHSENVQVSNPEVIFADTRSFRLQKVKKGNTLVVNNLFFDYNKADLKQESFPELEKLRQFMKENDRIYIEISGHTDSIGADTYNIKLSERRAMSVKTHLIGHGIAHERIRTIGHGESKPLASNKTEDGRRQNRRVECLIYDMEAAFKQEK